MLPIPAVLKPYAKAVIAVGGFVVIVGNTLTGAVDANGLVDAVTALLVAVGVHRTPNVPSA